MPSKRVWHISSNRWNSAVTEYALSCAQALSLKGWDCVFSPRKNSPAAERARVLGLAGPLFDHFGISDAPALVRSARSIQPDIILVYGGAETFLTRFIPATPTLRFRGQDSDANENLSLLGTRIAMSHCRGILAPSQLIQKRFQALMGSKPVHLVPLGLSLDRFQFLPEAWRSSERPVLRILGRLDPVKGHGPFFAVFSQLLANWNDGHTRPLLEVIGEEANLKAQDLRRMAAEYGLVEGRDWRLRLERLRGKDLKELMSTTQLAIIPSLSSEIICRVGEEFLLAGCPIFVSGAGSLDECLFREDAGASYRQLSLREQISLLRTWILRASAESLGQRQERAQRAAELFSLGAMGHCLNEVLNQHLTQPLLQGAPS